MHLSFYLRAILARLIIIALLVLAVLSPLSVCQACEETETLFIIERSKNSNTVHYDACIDGSDSLSAADPVIAYWVLEDGKREELGSLDRKFAYGIKLLEKMGNDSVRIAVAGMKKMEITIEKIGMSYKAVTLIRGKKSILERVYIKSLDKKIGLPTVIFVDLFGKTKTEGISVSERIEKSQERL